MPQLLLVNPRKRRKATKRRRTTAKRRRNPLPAVRMSNPRKRRSVRRRRNPIAMKNIMTQVTDAAMMAGGAVVTDLISAKLPIPADIKTGQFAPLVRAGIALGVGFIVEKGLKQRALGRKMAEGSLVVIAHDTITKLVGQRLGLSAYEEMSAYQSANMSGYSDLLLESRLSGNDLLGNDSLLGESEFDSIVAMSGMGYANAAPAYDDSDEL